MGTITAQIQLTEAELKLLQTLVYQECGMFFDERRSHFLKDRLQRRLKACQMDSFYSCLLYTSAAPLGVQHARGTCREPFQKSRKMPRLGRINGKLHQFIGFAVLWTSRSFGFAAATQTTRGFRGCSRHV